MLDDIIVELKDAGETTSRDLEIVNHQLVAIRSTHSTLNEYIFQAFLKVRTIETTEEKLQSIVESMLEIKKYTQQEIEKYSNTVSALSGKIQGFEDTIKIIEKISAESVSDEESEESEVDTSEVPV